MKSTITLRRDTNNVKKAVHLKNGVFLFFVPKKLKISSMQFERYYTEIMVILPKNDHRYFTSKFKTDEIEAISGNQQ